MGVRKVVYAVEKTAKNLAIVDDAANRDTAETDAVIAAFAANQPCALPFATGTMPRDGNFQGSINAFRAGVGVKHMLHAARRDVDHPVGEFKGFRMPHLERRGIVKFGRLPGNRFHDPGPGMASIAAPQSCRPVQHLAPIGGGVVHALRRDEQARGFLKLAVRRKGHPESAQIIGNQRGAVRHQKLPLLQSDSLAVFRAPDLFVTNWSGKTLPFGVWQSMAVVEYYSSERSLMPKTANSPTTRIQREKSEQILMAALDVFSNYGFRGSTLDQIAEAAGMSKPNLLYYFDSKETIHARLLERLLETWLAPLQELDSEGDALNEISDYIRRKLEMARDLPRESRLFANEILQGAPRFLRQISGPLKELVDEKADVIRNWIAKGQMVDTDPYHLIFSIWATTQHYADFDVQVQAVLGARSDQKFVDAERFLIELFRRGLAVA